MALELNILIMCKNHKHRPGRRVRTKEPLVLPGGGKLSPMEAAQFTLFQALSGVAGLAQKKQRAALLKALHMGPKTQIATVRKRLAAIFPDGQMLMIEPVLESAYKA